MYSRKIRERKYARRCKASSDGEIRTKLISNTLKRATFWLAKKTNAFELLKATKWRTNRLLILCYHGIAFRDEHMWRPLYMYMTREFFRSRMEFLARGKYSVLPLGDALKRLGSGTLPPKSVVITFDDGFYDFYMEAYPILRRFEFPATVYQTTYYSDHPVPLFNLMASYLLWRGSERQLNGDFIGMNRIFHLEQEAQRNLAYDAIYAFVKERKYSPAERNMFAGELAARLGVDYKEIERLGMLRCMNAQQIKEIANNRIDVQLHTHRHRTPREHALFVREIQDNRNWIRDKLSYEATHFCYPAGVYYREFLPWLRSEGVVSATTCDPGLACAQTEFLLLPRLLDSMNFREVEFEAWVSGFSGLLPGVSRKRGIEEV